MAGTVSQAVFSLAYGWTARKLRLAALRCRELYRVRGLDDRASAHCPALASALRRRRGRPRHRTAPHAGPRSWTPLRERHRAAMGHRGANGRRHRVRAAPDGDRRDPRPRADRASLAVPPLRRDPGHVRPSLSRAGGGGRGARGDSSSGSSRSRAFFSRCRRSSSAPASASGLRQRSRSPSRYRRARCGRFSGVLDELAPPAHPGPLPSGERGTGGQTCRFSSERGRRSFMLKRPS